MPDKPARKIDFIHVFKDLGELPWRPAIGEAWAAVSMGEDEAACIAGIEAAGLVAG